MKFPMFPQKYENMKVYNYRLTTRQRAIQACLHQSLHASCFLKYKMKTMGALIYDCTKNYADKLMLNNMGGMNMIA